MGKAGAVKKAAEAAGLLNKTSKLKAADVVGKGDLAELDDMAAFDRISGEADAAELARTPQDVLNRIEAAKLEEREVERVTALRPDSEFRGYDPQAFTPEEFAQRVPQFRQEKYVKGLLEKNIPTDNMQNPLEKGMKHEERWARWQKDADQVHRITRTNPDLTNWAKEGVYKRKDFFGPDVEDPDGPLTFFRMDIRQDPRAELSPIQFDPAANEFGMHIGSRQAGRDIISPQVTANMKERFTKVRSMMDEIADDPALVDEGVDMRFLFEEAFKEVRTNMFLRHGEDYKSTPTVDDFKMILEDFWIELRQMAREKGVGELTDPQNSEAFNKRLLSIMRYQYDPKQHPVLTNVKQGLLVQDVGSNTADNIAREQIGRGIFDDDMLESVRQAPNAEANVMLRDMLREKGYDHLVYLNDAEDHGTMSIVLFDEDNYQNVLKPTKVRKGGPRGFDASAAIILAPLAAALGLEDNG